MMPKSHAVARERGPPFFYKKAAQPTSGARAISSEWVDYGWSVPLTKETTERIKKVLIDANSMYVLQIKRHRPVEPYSMRNALFWQHRKLPNQRIVSTPGTDHFGFFSSDERDFTQSIDEIKKTYSDDGESVRMHKLFESIREREFLVWPIDFDGVWVTLILRIQPKNPDIMKAEQVSSDREVTDISIIDLWEEDRKSRRNMIIHRLPQIMAQGNIGFANDIKGRNFFMDDVSHEWKTGYVSYAVSSEFLRRLKSLTWRREVRHIKDFDFIWEEFEERYNIDLYRQSMMAACAHQCIERSEYRVRMCLEVPSDGSQYFPDELSHINAPTVTLHQEQIPDERYSFAFEKDEDTRPVVLHLTESSRERAEADILRKKKQVIPGRRTQPPQTEETSTDQNRGRNAIPGASSIKIPGEPSAAPVDRWDTTSLGGGMAIRDREARELHLQRHNIRDTPQVPSRDPNATPVYKSPRFRYKPRAGRPEPDPQDLATGGITIREGSSFANSRGNVTAIQVERDSETPHTPNERYIGGGVYANVDSDSSSEEDESQELRMPVVPMEPTSFAHTYTGIPGLSTLNTIQPSTTTSPGVPRLNFEGPGSEDVSMDNDHDLFGDNPTGLVAKTPEGGLSPRLNFGENSAYNTSAEAPPLPQTLFNEGAYGSSGTRGPVPIQNAWAPLGLAQGNQYPGVGADDGGVSEFQAPFKRQLDDDRKDSGSKKARYGRYL